MTRLVAVALAASLAALAVPASASSGTAVAEADATRSASLAGVARREDAEPADLAADATYALPGLIHADRSLDDLRTLFGAKHVKLAEIDAAEGETALGVVLFADDPTRRAELFFRDPERKSGIDGLRVRASGSRWHLDNGIRIGMTLAELVRANGMPVSFGGLDWDYGGGITDWHGGKFTQKEQAPFRTVLLDHAEDAKGYPMGEGAFRSDDPRYPQQGKVLRVGEIGVSFASD